jgi:hypothetical protein
MRFRWEIALRRTITTMMMSVYTSTKLFPGKNNGRERQHDDHEKSWHVTMWNPTEKLEKS